MICAEPVPVTAFLLLLWLTGVACDSRAGAAVAPLADPTRPFSAAAAASNAHSQGAESLQLQSILVSAVRRVAIINGNPVTVGEQVNGDRVMAIGKDRVTLKSATGTITTLRLVDAVRNQANNN